MDSTIIVAIISLAGTALGTFGGIITANRLTNYRIQQLEEKVKVHNGIVERMYVVEGSCRRFDCDIKEIKTRIERSI